MHQTLNKRFKTPQLRGFLLVVSKQLNLLPLESIVQVCDATDDAMKRTSWSAKT